MVEPIELHAADLSACAQACKLQIAPFHGKLYVAEGLTVHSAPCWQF